MGCGFGIFAIVLAGTHHCYHTTSCGAPPTTFSILHRQFSILRSPPPYLCLRAYAHLNQRTVAPSEHYENIITASSFIRRCGGSSAIALLGKSLFGANDISQSCQAAQPF